MSAHPPPIPPDQRSPKGAGEPAKAPEKADVKPPPAKADKTALDNKTGQQGAVGQNTRNQGYQQDR